MIPLAALAAVVALAPLLDAPEGLRLVATGTGPHPVTWVMDGRVVARTMDGQAATVPGLAGPHRLEALSAAPGAWSALVRPDPGGGEGMAYVPAWAGRAEPQPRHPWAVAWPLGLAAVAVAAALVAHPKRP